MRTLGRFALGLVLGFILVVWSVTLAAAGHGTVVPLAAAFPELLLVLMLAGQWGLWGFWLVVVPAAVLLWAIYFGFFPAIKSSAVRAALMTIIGVVHFGAGVLSLSIDSGFVGMAKTQPVLTIGFFVFLSLVMLALGARIWAGPNFRLRNASS